MSDQQRDNIVYTVIYAAFAATVTLWINTILSTLRDILFKPIKTTQTYVIDDLILKTGYATTMTAGSHQIPDSGLHIGYLDGWFLAIKFRIDHGSGGSYTLTYQLYAFGKCRKSLSDACLIKHETSKPYFNQIRISRKGTPKSVVKYIRYPAKSWQENAMKIILDAYKKAGKNVSVLLCGPPGIGKSYLACLIGHTFYVDEPTKIGRANVYPHIDFSREVMFSKFLDYVVEDKYYPVVVNVNELHEVITSHSNNAADGSPVALNNFLDEINSARYTIIIGSTNTSLADLERDHARVIRPGRFDIKIDLFNNPDCNIEEVYKMNKMVNDVRNVDLPAAEH